MDLNIILAGVGGQGILTIAYILANAALDNELNVKQSEVHGMSQRGGAVYTHIRIADKPVHSDLISKGDANFILSVEPLEALRYEDYLAPDGMIISNTQPEINIPDYPDLDTILDRIRSREKYLLLDAKDLAKKVGASRAQNIVLVGALSKFIGFPEEIYLRHIEGLFGRKGERVVKSNNKAFALGREAAQV